MTIRTYRSIHGHTAGCIREAAAILSAQSLECTELQGLIALRTGDIDCRCDIFRSDLVIR